MDKKIICKLKNECLLYTGNSISDGDKDKFTDKEEAYPYISTKDIHVSTNKIDYYNDMFIKKNENKFKIAPKNSILLCIEGGSAGKKIAVTNQPVAFVNKLCCINSNKNTKYYYYYLQSHRFVEDFRLNMSGLIGGVSVSKLKDIKIITYPIEIQNKIVDFLDNKCSKIDELIEGNKRIIKLIEEYKNQYLEKKFEEISEESNKIRLKYLGNLQNGISAGAEKFGNGKGTFINYGDVYNYDVIPNAPKGIMELNEKEIEKYSLKRGDILFTRTSETIEEVGISAVCTKDYPNSAFSGFVIRFRPFNTEIMLPDFYKYYFKLKTHRDYFAREMNLVTRASLSQGLLGDIKILVPSIKKQNIIANKIDKKFDSLNTTINYRKQIIEKLEEYKKSLIYEVVTGKKDIE